MKEREKETIKKVEARFIAQASTGHIHKGGKIQIGSQSPSLGL